MDPKYHQMDIEGAKLKSSNEIEDLANVLDSLPEDVAQSGEEKVCNTIIERGKPPNHVSEEQTWGEFVICACEDKDKGKELIQSLGHKLRAVVNKVAFRGLTPLQLALSNDNVGAAEALLELGADLSAKWKGHNLLRFCVLKNALEGVKFVHDRDNEQIRASADCEDVMLLAAEHAGVEMCEWLMHKGRSIFSVDEKSHATFFHYAAKNKHHGKEILLHAFEIIDLTKIKDVNDETALHYALKCENFDVAQAMIGMQGDCDEYPGIINLLHFCVKNNLRESAKSVHAWDSNQMKDLMKLGKKPSQLTTDAEMKLWISCNSSAFATTQL